MTIPLRTLEMMHIVASMKGQEASGLFCCFFALSPENGSRAIFI
jgi:hypothetical protein